MNRVVRAKNGGLSNSSKWISPLLFFAASGLLSLYWYSNCENNLFLALALVASVVGTILVALYERAKDSWNKTSSLKFFSVILGASCFIFVFIFPPFSVPDEAHHYMSSYWMADCLMGQCSLDDSDDIPIRKIDLEYVELFGDPTVGVDNYRDALNSFEWFEADSDMTTSKGWDFDFGSENPTAKIGSITGILIGRILHLGAAPTFYLGRMLSSVFYSICVVAAVAISPLAKSVLASVALLPMSLHLAASYSYDSAIIGLSMLLFSLLLRAIYLERVLDIRTMISIVIVACLLAPCKLVYASLLLLTLFIPQNRFESRKTAWVFRLSLLGAVLLAILLFRMVSIGDLATVSADGDMRGNEVGQFYSLGDIISNPLKSIAIFFRTFESTGDFYFFSMLGSYPAWIQGTLAVPSFFMMGYFIVALWCAQPNRGDSETVPSSLRIVMMLIFAGVVAAVMLSMMLGWTFNDELVISGVQGRYFLPVLPVALLAARCKSLQIVHSTFLFEITAYSCLNILYLVRMVSIALVLP